MQKTFNLKNCWGISVLEEKLSTYQNSWQLLLLIVELLQLYNNSFWQFFVHRHYSPFYTLYIN